MAEYRFLQFYSDTVPAGRAIPTFVRVDAESREQAIQKFARKFGLNVDSDDGETVWFVREEDGVVCQYMIAWENDKAPTEQNGNTTSGAWTMSNGQVSKGDRRRRRNTARDARIGTATGSPDQGC